MANLDPDLRREAYIARNAPSEHEIGWLGHGNQKFKGDDKHVQIEFDPSDPEIKQKYIYHTHPGEPSPMTAMPSEMDLISAVMAAQEGIQGVVIFSHPYYTIIAPTDRVKSSHFRDYVEAVGRQDIEDAVNALKRAGFDVETGKL